jgi:putative tryptophan/tyrosine transport system substrate-binding protein
VKRRDFITGLAGATMVPAAAWAQQAERARRIGVLLPAAADDAEFQAWVGAFVQALALSGWTNDHNVRIDTRWATANPADIRRHAAELAALAPDVILAHGASTVGPLLLSPTARTFQSKRHRNLTLTPVAPAGRRERSLPRHTTL